MPHPFDLPRPAHMAAFLADRRRRGAPFPEAWSDALEVVCRFARERDSWLVAFVETRDSWQRAYEGEPATAAEVTLGDLAPALIGDLDGDGAAVRRCAHCDRPLPANLKPTARYCPGGRCRRAAAYERERRIADRRNPAAERLERKLPTARNADRVTSLAAA
jgi:hypothetical protein